MTSSPGLKVRQALFMAAQGMYVFPLVPGWRVPVRGCERCSPSSPQYVPHTASECECLLAGRGTTCHGSHAATVDTDTIHRWWDGRNAEAGIGIHLAKSGLVMLDLDSHKSERVSAAEALPGVTPTITAGLTAADGWDSMAMLAAEMDQPDPWNDPSAMKVLTPSGGLHIWYRTPQADLYRNVDGKLAWQVDFKAGSAFAVVPGTSVQGKGVYRGMPGSRSEGGGPTILPAWLDAEIRRVGGRVADAPGSRLRDRVRASQSSGDRRAQSQPPTAAFIDQVMSEALGMLASALSGHRNATLNAAAFKVGRALLARDETLWDDLGSVLEDAAVAGGTPAHEARATIRSGFLGGKTAGSK